MGLGWSCQDLEAGHWDYYSDSGDSEAVVEVRAVALLSGGLLGLRLWEKPIVIYSRWQKGCVMGLESRDLSVWELDSPDPRLRRVLFIRAMRGGLTNALLTLFNSPETIEAQVYSQGNDSGGSQLAEGISPRDGSRILGHCYDTLSTQFSQKEEDRKKTNLCLKYFSSRSIQSVECDFAMIRVQLWIY